MIWKMSFNLDLSECPWWVGVLHCLFIWKCHGFEREPVILIGPIMLLVQECWLGWYWIMCPPFFSTVFPSCLVGREILWDCDHSGSHQTLHLQVSKSINSSPNHIQTHFMFFTKILCFFYPKWSHYHYFINILYSKFLSELSLAHKSLV